MSQMTDSPGTSSLQTRLNPSKIKRRLLYLKTQSVLSISVIKTNQFMLYGAKVAVCFELNTKHTHAVWQNVKFLNVKPVDASRNQ